MAKKDSIESLPPGTAAKILVKTVAQGDLAATGFATSDLVRLAKEKAEQASERTGKRVTAEEMLAAMLTATF